MTITCGGILFPSINQRYSRLISVCIWLGLYIANLLLGEIMTTNLRMKKKNLVQFDLYDQ